MIDYVNKEIIKTFCFSRVDDFDSKEFVSLGRTYFKIGKLQNITFIGLMYKVYDTEMHRSVYKLHIGYTKQHPNDINNTEDAYENAYINTLSKPALVLDIENPKVFTNRMFVDLVNIYSETIKRSFVKTAQEKKLGNK